MLYFSTACQFSRAATVSASASASAARPSAASRAPGSEPRIAPHPQRVAETPGVLARPVVGGPDHRGDQVGALGLQPGHPRGDRNSFPLSARAILLARLSDKREDVDLTDEGIPRSLEDQIQRMRDRAGQLGWDVWKVIKNT